MDFHAPGGILGKKKWSVPTKKILLSDAEFSVLFLMQIPQSWASLQLSLIVIQLPKPLSLKGETKQTLDRLIPGSSFWVCPGWTFSLQTQWDLSSCLPCLNKGFVCRVEEFWVTQELLSTVWALSCRHWRSCQTTVTLLHFCSQKANAVQAACPWFLLSWFNIGQWQGMEGRDKVRAGLVLSFPMMSW